MKITKVRVVEAFQLYPFDVVYLYSDIPNPDRTISRPVVAFHTNLPAGQGVAFAKKYFSEYPLEVD